MSIKRRQSRHNQRIDCSKNIDRRPIFQRNQKDLQVPSENIEDPVLRTTYARLTASQWKDLYPKAILDEVQKEPQLIESIKSVYDQWETPRYVLSGSSQLLLLEKVKETLAGRCTIIDLYPLTIPELETESWDDQVADSPFQAMLEQPDDIAAQLKALVLSSWTKNEAKRLVKAPKIHVLDYGVLQAVVQKRGSPTGPEFESLVVAELYKQAKTMRSDARFWYLRTLDGREVDLLIELSQGYLAFEIKTSERASLSDARHLRSVSGLLDKPLLHAFVLSNDPAAQLLTPTITALHAAQLLG